MPRSRSTTQYRAQYPAGVPCPETVLVVVMSDGSGLLVSHPQSEPAAFIAGGDADLLRQALAEEFGYPTDGVANEHGNNNGDSVVIESEAV